MRILVIYDYSISEAVRKWVQRHPELNGMTYFGNRAEFEVDPHDVQALARIYHYFSQKKCEVYHLKKVNPGRILQNYVILSYRPFEVVPRGDPRACPGPWDTSEVLENVPRSTDISQGEGVRP